MSAQKRGSGRVTPSKKQRAAGSTPKGRVPVAKERSSSRAKAPKPPKAADTPQPRAGRGRDAAVDDAPLTPEVVDAGPVAAPAFNWKVLVVVFFGAQLATMVLFSLIVPQTPYSVSALAGTGGSIGQASGQNLLGQALDVAIPIPIWLSTVLQLPLWVGLGVAPVVWAIKKGKGVVAELGLTMKPLDVPIGLAIGVATQFVVVPAIYWLVFGLIGQRDISAEARELTDRATDPLAVILVYVIVGIGAPIAEEIYYRGVCQRVFGRRLRPHWAILAAAAFFAASHLQPLQFPGLLAFGVIVGVLAWRSGRLGLSIWAHLGFNVAAATTLLFGIGWG